MIVIYMLNKMKMGNYKKFSLLICLFLIVNQDIIGNKQFGGNLEKISAFKHEYSLQASEPVDSPAVKKSFLNLPHTAIYTK